MIKDLNVYELREMVQDVNRSEVGAGRQLVRAGIYLSALEGSYFYCRISVKNGKVVKE